MGVIDRVKEDFYQLVISEHVLLLCALDVDSLCACKILQCLFKGDDVEHTVMPVAGKADAKAAYNDHADQVKSVVLINCGGGVNLVELLELDPQSRVQLYIIDSQRPLDLDNVYNQDNIHVVMRERDQLDVPAFDDIYSSYLDEDDYDEVFSDDESASKRRKLEEDSYETRRKKHLWRRKREAKLTKYYGFNYHETAASLVVYELACRLNRDCNELVWLAITGLTDQLLHEKIDSSERYVTDIQELEHNVLRHNRSDEDAPPSAVNSMRISFENELRLVLYRHWTLLNSLCHSEYTVCRFKTWSMKGQKKLRELLANMGLPLVQCQQKFLSMDVKHRQNLKQLVNDVAHKFQLENITYSSFVAHFGYRTVLCASDMVFGSTAIMEDTERPYSECFLRALEALSRPNMKLMTEGIALAKQQQVAIVEQVRNFIDTHQVVCTGPFIYAVVQEGTPNVKMFSKVVTLCKLARFLRGAWIVTNRKARDLPFIVSAPLDIDKGVCLMVGVPPYSDDSRKSEFSKAFQYAADRINAHASFDHFNGSVVEISKEERSKFLDMLVALSEPD